MNARSVDVLIVGLGPAGASAAAVAARAGLQVLAVDRRQEVGVPVQCAEFIPLPLARHARAAGVLQQRVAGMNSGLPSGARVNSAFPGLMIDRAAFDQALAADARRGGAELLQSTRFTDLDARRDIATLLYGGQPLQVGYRMLIAADGPHSPVGRALGLPPLQTVQTRQYAVPLLQPHGDTDIWLADDYPGGYAWLFPKGRCANLGLGADPDSVVDLKRPLDALHRQLVEQGRVGAEIMHRTGGAIPVGGLRHRLAVGNVLFVGDAAGLAHPITGAGIAAAMASGELAGEAAARWLARGDNGALAEFEQEVRAQFEPTLRRALERRRWLAQRQRGQGRTNDATHRKAWVAFPEYFEPVG
jgi:digeranylgeranylglycerophospholipid reductase